MSGDRGAGRNNAPSAFATFIVRISRDDAGRISGVVEWVRTGEKIQFHGLPAISGVIARMFEGAK